MTDLSTITSYRVLLMSSPIKQQPKVAVALEYFVREQRLLSYDGLSIQQAVAVRCRGYEFDCVCLRSKCGDEV